MAKMKFDKRSIDGLPFTTKGQIDYFDTLTPGLGLRVGTNSKTFFVKADARDPYTKTGYRTVKKTIGRYGEMTLEQARRELRGYDDREKGFVPGKRLELKRGATNGNGATVTLSDVLTAYFEEKRTRSGEKHKESTVNGYTDRLQRHFASWLALSLPAVAKLTPETVIERHKQISANRGAYEARNSFAMLNAVVAYAGVKYPATITNNPISFLTRSDAGFMPPIRQRDECLKGNDFKQFHEGIQTFHEVVRDAYLFTLYHGTRRRETEGLRWEHLDLEKKVLTIPDTKNRRPLHVPISFQALAILERCKERNTNESPFVFAAIRKMNKTGHVRLQAQDLKFRTGLNITVQALRRSFITIGRKLKFFEDADRLTNHVDGSVTGKHYDGTDVDDLRQPLQTICNEIERLMVEGVGAKVVQLPTAQGQ